MGRRPSIDFGKWGDDVPTNRPGTHARARADASAQHRRQESELGQAILRDLVLSFTLPRRVVGVRRTALLSRACNARITNDYATQLQTAHEVALRGCAWTFSNDDDVIHRTAALLAGLATLLLAGSTRAVRTEDMFAGYVRLPFLETAPPPKNHTPGKSLGKRAFALHDASTANVSDGGYTRLRHDSRLMLMEHTNEWIVYSMPRAADTNAASSPCVLMRQSGYDGLCHALLLLLSLKEG